MKNGILVKMPNGTFGKIEGGTERDVAEFIFNNLSDDEKAAATQNLSREQPLDLPALNFEKRVSKEDKRRTARESSLVMSHYGEAPLEIPSTV
jgi:hypothetical protein